MAEYSGRDKRLAYLFDAVENVQVDDMTGASASTDGAHGLVPAPLAGDEDKYLKGDGTWAAVQAGAGSLSGLSDVDLSSPTDGQALVYDGANSKWKNGNVSGGTLVIQDASIYSTDEQQIGVWIDGKPLYQKTYEFSTVIPVSANVYTTLVSSAGLNIDTLVYGETSPSKEATFTPISVNVTANGDIQCYYNTAWSIKYLTIRYTKTTDAAGSGGYKAYGLSPIIYSTEEREVGVWTDGKPLYQKTFNLNNQAVTDKAWTSGLLGTSQSGISIKHYEGYFGLTGQPRLSQFAYYRESNEYFTAMLNADEDDISVRPNMNAGVAVTIADVTIWYTKTTDTAGSGTWITTGEYAHHYSTSEKVIGTWIDGSTIYERTWSGLNQSVTANAWNVITGISIANLGIVTDARAYRTSGQGLTGLGVRAFQNTGNSSNNPQIVPLESQTLDTLILQYTKIAS